MTPSPSISPTFSPTFLSIPPSISDACSRFWKPDDVVFTNAATSASCVMPTLLMIVYGGTIACVATFLIIRAAKLMIYYRAEMLEKMRAAVDPEYAHLVKPEWCTHMRRSVRFTFFAGTILFAITYVGYSATAMIYPFVSEGEDATAMHALQSVVLFLYFSCMLRLSQMTNVSATSEGFERTPNQVCSLVAFFPAVISELVFYIGVAAGLNEEIATRLFVLQIATEFILVTSVMKDVRDLGLTIRKKRESMGIPMGIDDVGERMIDIMRWCSTMHFLRILALTAICLNALFGGGEKGPSAFIIVGCEIASQLELLLELCYLVVKLPNR